MSIPAHELVPVTVPRGRSAPAPPAHPPEPFSGPSRLAQPSRRAAARPGPAGRRRSVGRARRGVHLRFSIFAGIVLAFLAIGVVALNVLLAQSAFHVTALQQEVGRLSTDYDALTNQEAGLSSPSRVAAWAHGRGMAAASHQVIIHVDPMNRGPSPPPDASGDSAGQALALEPVPGGGR